MSVRRPDARGAITISALLATAGSRCARSRWIRAAILILALITATTATAQYVRSGLGQFTHTRWTIDDGAPTGISRIVQTPDGWLWLATSDGLFRFDGASFERIAPPAGSPMERATPASLLVTRSGALWVGFAQNGGVAVYRNGVLQAIPMAKPPARILALTQTRDGAIWATAGVSYRDERLFRWIGGRWEAADRRFDLPGGFPGIPCVTANGTLWQTVEGGNRTTTFALPPGAKRFEPTPFHGYGANACAIDRQGRMWMADWTGTRLAVDADGRVLARPINFPPVPKLEQAGLAFDPAGGLWGSTNAAGIFYIPNAASARRTQTDRLEQFVAADGLTSNVVRQPFVDREGNIWFGSDLGLDRFRPSIAVREPRIAGDPGRGFAMSAAGGQVFVSSDQAVYQILSGAPRKMLDGGLLGICSAQGGGFWGVLQSRITRVANGRRTPLAPPAGEVLIGTCAEDKAGRLWLGIMPGGAIWHDAQGWHRPARQGPVMHEPDLIVSPRGGVAYVAADSLVRLDGDMVTTLGLKPYDIGTITKLAAGVRDLFISGNNGLLRIRGDRIARLDARRYPWVARLRGLVQTPQGETWLRSDHAISRVSTAALDRSFDRPGAPLDRRDYDLRDGLSPAQNAAYPGQQLAVSDDGRIVMLERPGVSLIDPAKLARDRTPPAVAIKSLSSGGGFYRDPVSISLPAGTRGLDIEYASLNLASPHRAAFRYRLDGVDDDWVSPGARRLASYANLAPGTYRFNVIAANRDGVWSKEGATLDIEIPPTFVQSWPFKLLCAVLVMALLWAAYAIRLRSVANRIRARMGERIAERERIARELHDTLLQSVQSLTLRFQLVVDDLAIEGPPRLALEAAIDRADRLIAEGRDRVLELRPPQEQSDLAALIAEFVRQQSFDPDVAIAIQTIGTPRRLDPVVLDEVTRIAREAIFNIRQHAKADRVRIEIGFRSSFSLMLVDNGIGIDPMILDKGGRDGHFGLAGMRERACKLQGHLEIRRPAEGGTRVTVTVPGRIAYRSAKPGWLLGNRGAP